MSGFFAVYRREMLSLWVTPLAWVLLVVFLLIQGLSFYSIVVHISKVAQISVDSGPVQAYFGQSIFLDDFALARVSGADDALVRRGASQRHDRSPAHRAGHRGGRRARQVPGRPHDLRR